jgi:hypothetical protein
MSDNLPRIDPAVRRARERAEKAGMISGLLFVLLAAVSVLPYFVLRDLDAPRLLTIFLSPIRGGVAAWLLITGEPSPTRVLATVIAGAVAFVLWVYLLSLAMANTSDPSWIVVAAPVVVSALATVGAFVAWRSRKALAASGA